MAEMPGICERRTREGRAHTVVGKSAHSGDRSFQLIPEPPYVVEAPLTVSLAEG